MQRIFIIIISLMAMVALLLLFIAVLLIWVPEMLVTDLRGAVTVACGIAGVGILAPVIQFLVSSIRAKYQDRDDTDR